MNLKKLSIKWKLLIAFIAMASIPISISSILSYNSAKSQLTKQIENLLQKQVKIIHQNAENTYTLLEQKLKTDLNVASQILSSYGSPKINSDNDLVLINEQLERQVQEKVKSDLAVAHLILYNKGLPYINRRKKMVVKIINQVTKEESKIRIPQMEIARQKIAFRYGIVDQIKQRSGVETATIFQVIPQGLLRISTNVLKLDGSRAVGTYIPKDSPVYKSVMKRRTYIGKAFVVNEWYKTAYEPIVNKRNQVIGVLYVGAKEKTFIVNQNTDIVDEIHSQIGGTATIFQLKAFQGEQADDPTTTGWSNDTAMYRISTNVKKKDGTRAVGTIVSKPVFDRVMEGEIFYGRAWVVNAWYMTAYSPLKDFDNKICGILYVGVKEEIFQNTLTEQLKDLVIGNSGYISILNKKGEYVLSKNRLNDGQNIFDFKDADGHPYIQDIIEKAQVIKKGESSVQSYRQKGDNSEIKQMMSMFTYFPEWEWIISTVIYEEDFTEGLDRMRMIAIAFTIASILIRGFAIDKERK